MKNKKVWIFSILGIISILIVTLGITYAFFNYAKEGMTDNSITTGKITFLYEEIDKQKAGISLENAFPISDEVGRQQEGNGKVFHFTIKSDTISNMSIPYVVTARVKDTSTLDPSAVKLYLTELEGDTEKPLTEKIFSRLRTATQPTIPEGTVEKVIYKGEVPENTANYQKNFCLRMWIDESIDFSPVEKDGEIIYPYNDKTFTITVNVYSEGEQILPPVPTIEKIDSDFNEGLWAHKSEITKIIIQDELSDIEGSNIEKYEIASEDSVGQVVSYYDPNQKIAYIQGDGGIALNPNSSYLFSGFSNLTAIEGLELLDTSHVTNMSSMFSNSQIENLDLNSWDTSNVTNMSFMFKSSQIETLDLNSWDTSNVTNMNSMFDTCQVGTLNISDWDTSNVIYISAMFKNIQVETLDLNNWDISHVLSMDTMFSYSQITNLNISDWDTSHVTSMYGMFSNSQIQNLDISNWDTGSVTDMAHMFLSSQITNLDLSKWDTSHVTAMYEMFLSSALETLDLSNWDTSKVQRANNMFSGCSKLVHLKLNKLDISSMNDISYGFRSCGQLTTTINIYGFSSNVNYRDMFAHTATAEGAKIVVNYTKENKELVEQMVQTAGNDNVVLGKEIK